MHFLVYGKSDLVNADENRNADFQAGFRVGYAARDDFGVVNREIAIEGSRRGNPPLTDPAFAEWKRGVYAAHVQWIFALAVK